MSFFLSLAATATVIESYIRDMAIPLGTAGEEALREKREKTAAAKTAAKAAAQHKDDIAQELDAAWTELRNVSVMSGSFCVTIERRKAGKRGENERGVRKREKDSVFFGRERSETETESSIGEWTE